VKKMRELYLKRMGFASFEQEEIVIEEVWSCYISFFGSTACQWWYASLLTAYCFIMAEKVAGILLQDSLEKAYGT
jgi:hypothetical protein